MRTLAMLMSGQSRRMEFVAYALLAMVMDDG